MTLHEYQSWLRRRMPNASFHHPDDDRYDEGITRATILREWQLWRRSPWWAPFRPVAPRYSPSYDCNKLAQDFIVHVRRAHPLAPIWYERGWSKAGDAHGQVGFKDADDAVHFDAVTGQFSEMEIVLRLEMV
jgi:hypothetical protein